MAWQTPEHAGMHNEGCPERHPTRRNLDCPICFLNTQDYTGIYRSQLECAGIAQCLDFCKRILALEARLVNNIHAGMLAHIEQGWFRKFTAVLPTMVLALSRGRHDTVLVALSRIASFVPCSAQTTATSRYTRPMSELPARSVSKEEWACKGRSETQR